MLELCKCHFEKEIFAVREFKIHYLISKKFKISRALLFAFPIYLLITTRFAIYYHENHQHLRFSLLVFNHMRVTGSLIDQLLKKKLEYN